MLDAVILSDIHLGSANCEAKAVCEFLERLADHHLETEKLILNGDVFDSIDFRRLTKNHWKVLSLLRKLSDRIEIIWICGNHDGSAEIVSHLLGVQVADEYTLLSGQEKVLFLHGHQFDEFIDSHPWLTWIGDTIYMFLQKIDRTHYFAKLAKRGSKTFLRCAQKIQEGSIEHARRKGCTIVCCGHTHHALERQDGPVPYFNSGCWTERPCSYLTVAHGQVDMHSFVRDDVEEAVVEAQDSGANNSAEAPIASVPGR